MNTTSDMMADINKYAAIWDKAVANGVFDDATKPAVTQPGDDESTDFFGNYMSDEDDIDRPMNEVDCKYWAMLSKSAADRSAYELKFNEERKVSKKEAKAASNKLGSTFNPVYSNTQGKDQDVIVTQNWGVGGKKLNDLEDLKKRLYELEVKLNSAGIVTADKKKKKKDSDESTILKGLADLKAQIDELSNKLNGNRNDEN